LAAGFIDNAATISQSCVGLDAEFRSSVAKELITDATAASPPNSNCKRAALLLASELQLIDQFPELSFDGIAYLLSLPDEATATPESRLVVRNFGQWIDNIPPNSIEATLGPLLSKPEQPFPAAPSPIRSVVTLYSPNIASALVRAETARSGDDRLLRLLSPNAAATLAPEDAADVARQLLDLVKRQESQVLTHRLWQIGQKIPGGYGPDIATKALHTVPPDLSKIMQSDFMAGAKAIVSNLSPEAVPAVLEQLANWFTAYVEAESQKRRGTTHFGLWEVFALAAENVDPANTEAALQRYEAAIGDLKVVDSDLYRVLVQKMPRKSARLYWQNVSTDTTYSIAKMVGIVRGVAESDVALTSQERVELLEWILSTSRGYSARTQLLFDGETLASVCSGMTDEDRHVAVQEMLTRIPREKERKVRRSFSLAVSRLAGLSTIEHGNTMLRFGMERPSIAYGKALRKIVKVRPAGQLKEDIKLLLSAYHNFRIPLDDINTMLTQSEIVQLAKLLIENPEAYGNERYSAALVQHCPKSDRDDILRMVVDEADDQLATGKPAKWYLEFLALCSSRLPTEDADRLMETAVSAIERDIGNSYDSLDHDPTDEIARFSCGVARAVSPSAAPRFLRRILRAMPEKAGQRRTRLLILAGCMPGRFPSDHVDEIVRQLSSGIYDRPIAETLYQLALTASDVSHQFDDDQILELFAVLIELYEKIDGESKPALGTIVDGLMDGRPPELARRAVRLMQTHLENVERKSRLTSGLYELLRRLPVDDVAVMVDPWIENAMEPKIAGSVTAPPYKRPLRGPAFPHLAFRFWLNELEEAHRDRLVALFSAAKYKVHRLKMKMILPTSVYWQVEFDTNDKGEHSLQRILQEQIFHENFGVAEPLSIPRLVELLNHPMCSGSNRQEILSSLTARTGRKFGDPWQVVDAATDFSIPPDLMSRPK